MSQKNSISLTSPLAFIVSTAIEISVSQTHSERGWIVISFSLGIDVKGCQPRVHRRLSAGSPAGSTVLGLQCTESDAWLTRDCFVHER